MVVDVQEGFRNPHSEHVVVNIVRLVDGWVGAGLPLVFARFFNAPGSPYETISGWTELRTAEEQALVRELQPFASRAALIVDKAVSSALTPELTAAAAEHGWHDLVIAGIDTDACVYDTAVSVYHQGDLRPWIVTDACASTGGQEMHEAALMLARRNIGARQLLTVDSVLAQLHESAGVEETA